MWTKKLDKKLIILHVLYELYRINNRSEIRRAELKELCDDRLNQETNGTQESYGGGSFEICLAKLEKQKFLERVHNRRKETTIVSHINKIEYFLQREKLESSFGKVDQRIIEDVEDSILEEIIEEVYSFFLDRAVGLKYRQQPSESYYPIRKLVVSAFANMISRAFDFNISYDPTKIQLNKEFIMEIATPIFNVIKRNPETPFSVNVDYKGLSASTSTEVISQYEPRISQLSVDCFLSWTKSAYNYTVSEEDKRKLREGEDKALSKQALEYYRIFTDSVKDYLTLLKPTNPTEYSQLYLDDIK